MRQTTRRIKNVSIQAISSEDEEEEVKSDYYISASFPPTRFGIAMMLFATTFVGYIIRVNLSVSILGMVRAQQQTENETMKFDLPDVSAAVPMFFHLV